MLVRIHEGSEMVWVGDLDDLLDNNNDLSTAERKRLKGLEPGSVVEMGDGFKVERPANVPTIPRLPDRPLAVMDRARENAWKRYTARSTYHGMGEGRKRLIEAAFMDFFEEGWKAAGGQR